MVLPLPMRMGSLEVFVESTRARIRHGEPSSSLIDDLLAAFYEAAPGDPPLVPMAAVMGGGNGSADAIEIASSRSGAARDPAVHERLDERAEGRDDP